ncbi:MAG TPA: NAD(P)H-dependent oxidoreductase subunit E [Planctomycetota bacterium]|jgi:NADH-quinone oxidoreductase subunit F
MSAPATETKTAGTEAGATHPCGDACKCAQAAAEPVDMKAVDEIVARVGRKRENTIGILQALQGHFRYLPQEALKRVCATTEISPSDIMGVATFYNQFRHKPVGKHIVHVCHGTACHVKGSERVQGAIERSLKLAEGQDTDASGTFTVERVNCVGCCTLAPVVVIDESTYGHISPNDVPEMLQDFLASEAARKDAPALHPPVLRDNVPEIRVGLGSCCVANGSEKVREELEKTLAETGVKATVRQVGCVGMCHQTPLIEIVWPDGAGKPAEKPSKLAGGTHALAHPFASAHACDTHETGAKNTAPLTSVPHSVVYSKVQPHEVRGIIERHFSGGSLLRTARARLSGLLDWLLSDEEETALSKHELNARDQQVSNFLGRQIRLATEDCGSVDPLDLSEYIARGGFSALRKTLADLGPEKTIAEIEKSGLRGRGGAGFPTGRKWTVARAAGGVVPASVPAGRDAGPTVRKFMICNGDEGDPGAFMDRMILESYPYRVLEGMSIAAIAIGAHEGVLYIRAEYPLAVQRVKAAIERLEAQGFLGEKMCDGRYSLKLRVKEGAGAFVCGEETALIASVEGRRGMPRLRPPYPAQKGLWDCPTCVNNVETLAMVPWIIRHGAEAFAKLGTEKSKGTKVFALTGKVRNGGLIEVPMGITVRQIVEEIGGGVAPGRRFKAVQIGGPSGGCVPERLSDSSVDYETLREIGAIMGSGGLVVMDDQDCMVDIARYFLSFAQNECCGQCSIGRLGTRRLLDILERICEGKGKASDLTEAEHLGKMLQVGSLCGLCKTAPNPVLTTLKYFRDEYEAHLAGRCPAGKCKALIKYQVKDGCNGCTLCAQHCPVDAIKLTPYVKHVIDPVKCTRCDACRQVCPLDVVEVV